jgi:hypothetical protein
VVEAGAAVRNRSPARPTPRITRRDALVVDPLAVIA